MAVTSTYMRSHDEADIGRTVDPNAGVTARFFMEYKEKEVAEPGPDGKKPLMAIECVQIMIAGDKNMAPVFRVTDEHRARFAAAYEAFKRGEAQASGTRLEQMGKLDPMTIAKLNAVAIFTIEDLAAIPDSRVMGVMGMRQLRDEARVWLRVNVEPKASAVGQMAAQIEAMAAEIAALKAGKGADASDGDEPRRKPGRPRRINAEAAEAEAVEAGA